MFSGVLAKLLKSLTIFVKRSIVDVWQGPGYASAIYIVDIFTVINYILQCMIRISLEMK